MTTHRFGHLVAAVAFLAAAACSGQVGGGSAGGLVKASLALPPSAVTAIRVTVTGNGIEGFLYGDMTDLGGGNWAGTVPNVPPGGGYLVTAYAYNGPVPSDPINDSTNLIYKGAAADVSVTAGLTTPVFIVLIPYPNGGGSPGINTPPHIVFGGYPSSILSTDTVELSAAAWDPDAETVLSYTWDDGAAGGAFSPSDYFSGQGPGNTVTIYYTPATSFSGMVTIRLTVSDGQAEVSKSISFGVVPATGAVNPTLVFDSGPEIAILSVSSRELTAGGTAQISYETFGDWNGGPLNLSWTDSCSGGFSGYETSVPPFPFPGQATYVAPEVAPASPGECDLTLTVTDSEGAYTWSRVVEWVSPPQAQNSSGQFAVSQGTGLGDPAPVYNCVQACALLFGGAAGDWACSTEPDTVNHLAWYTRLGSTENCIGGTPLADNLDVTGTYSLWGESVSAYLADNCTAAMQGRESVNYCSQSLR
jgi:hypothetical protein